MRAGLFAVWPLVAWAATSQTGAQPSLQTRLSNHLAQPKFAAAAWGVKAVSAESGTTIFEHDAHKLLKPASNAKLYTGALALDRLGLDFRIKTSLLVKAPPTKSGTLRGDLVVFGRGDPTYAARFHNGAHTNLLAPIVDALVRAGVKRVTGNLVADESFFRGPPTGSQWAVDDLQHYYGAEVSALTVEDNTADLIFAPGARLGEPCRITTLPATDYLRFDNRARTVPAGSRRDISLYRPLGQNTVFVTGGLPLGGTNWIDAMAVHRPALWFVTLLKEEMGRRGIRVSGGLRAMHWLDREAQPATNLVEIAAVESRPLAEILPKMMKPSQNLYAQLLLLQVGAMRHHATNAAVSTEDLGLGELRDFLARTGIDRREVLLEDGSGLSRGTILTPGATVALLQFMRRHPHAQVFRDSLPVGGVDGTLRNRFKGTASIQNVRAKTGTLRHVNTLSGYVTTKGGEELTFSLMLNNYDGPTPRADLDALVVMLAEWAGESSQ